MKFSSVAVAWLPLSQAALFAKEEYESGAVMAEMMERKEAQWAKRRAAGEFNSEQWSGYSESRKADRIECIDGKAEAVAGDPLQTFRCKNIDMYDFKSHAELGSNNGEGSGSWGWVHEGREFIAIGQTDGTAFAEVDSSGELVYLGRLPHQSVPSTWREIKVNGDYLLVGSEAEGHNIQIFDLNKLLDVDPAQPVIFDIHADITGLFTDMPIGRSHNVVVNEELNYAVAVGSQPRNDSCAAGLIFINMDDPAAPFSPGCAPQDGYVHDAQCIVYRGPDKKYNGRDICYGYNEDSLTIYDVTNKEGPNASTVISKTDYVGASYSHQGWVLDPMWQTHLVLDDELDEGLDPNRTDPDSPAADGFPVTYIFDITNLEKPVNTGYYKSGTKSIDHNQYVHNGLSYQSNYGAGLRILDVSTIPEQPDGSAVEEVAYFDIYPEDDEEEGGGIAEFVGTWSHYTFPSGFIVVNTIERGPFLVKMSQFSRRGFGKRHIRR